MWWNFLPRSTIFPGSLVGDCVRPHRLALMCLPPRTSCLPARTPSAPRCFAARRPRCASTRLASDRNDVVELTHVEHDLPIFSWLVGGRLLPALPLAPAAASATPPPPPPRDPAVAAPPLRLS